MSASDLRPMDPSARMDVPKRPDQRIFDLYLLAHRWNAQFNEDDRGISLTDESIAWIAGDKAETAPLTSVVSVRLQYVYEAEERKAFRTCKIALDDGRRITVTDWIFGGRREHAPDYRLFVHDLHNRLVAYGAPSIRYLTGFDPQEIRVMRVLAGIAMLVCAAIAVESFGTPKSAVAIMFLAFAVIGYLFRRRKSKHETDGYEPTKLPEALIVGDG